MRLFIYCAGGVGRETYDIVNAADPDRKLWSEVCFIDDGLDSGHVCSARQFSFAQFQGSFSPTDCRVVIAHGEPSVRKSLLAKLCGAGYSLTRVIDGGARLSPSAQVGAGAIIYPHAYISSNAVIGENTIISVNSIIGHDSRIGKDTVVATTVSISGNCSIGSGCYIGTGACIKEGVHVGENTIIGMGSCVFRDIGPGMIVVGNPARESRPNVDHKVFRSSK